MKIGERVRVVASWSSFRGQFGTVVETGARLMVLLDGDRCPIRMGVREVEHCASDLWICVQRTEAG